MRWLGLSVNLESSRANYLLSRLLVGRNEIEQGPAFLARVARLRLENPAVRYFFIVALTFQNLTDLAFRVILSFEELGLLSKIADR